MKNNKASELDVPWYKYGMLWMVIVLPLIVVVASLITVYIAFVNKPDIIPRQPSVSQAAEVDSVSVKE